VSNLSKWVTISAVSGKAKKLYSGGEISKLTERWNL